MKERIRRGDNRVVHRQLKIPPIYCGKGLHNFRGRISEVADATNAIEEGKGVFITGPCGHGKTHLAVALLNFWFAKNFNWKRLEAEYLSVTDFFFRLRNSFEDNSAETMEQIVKPYVEYDASKNGSDRGRALLLLDDLGAQKNSEWSRECLYLIIDRRYREMLPTIITSNLSLDQIGGLIDDRIASRIAEMGAVIRLEDGDDQRVTAAFNTFH